MIARLSATLSAALVLSLAEAAPAAASGGFTQVTEAEQFSSLVEGRELTRFGITLRVVQDGTIEGRAFGRAVTGQWNWNGNYFCREMAYGATPVAADCQMVLLDGRTLRFISERGAGEHADLRLR